jgi:hypothetical protein
MPVTSEVNDEDKYVLDYFTEGERADDEPPFKYRTFYLDDALAEAWRITRDGGEVLSITQRGETAFDEETLKDALGKMSKLEGDATARDERELAARVLDESGEAEPESGEAAAQS